MGRRILPLTVLALCSLAMPCYAATSADIAAALEACGREGGTCMADLEASILAKTKGRAKRRDGVLTIRTQAGVVSLKDRPNAGDATLFNRYLGIIDGTGYHLVSVVLYEEGRVDLISDVSGESFSMAVMPHPSPSAKRFVSVSASEVGHHPNEITVWRVTPERLTLEYRYSPEEYALYTFLAWVGEDTIQLENYTYSKKEYCPKGQFMTIREVLKYRAGKWLLSKDASAEVRCQEEIGIKSQVPLILRRGR